MDTTSTLTTEELEMLLLERRLEEYAQTETQNGIRLDVEDLFDEFIVDMGYEKLAVTIELFRVDTVRDDTVREVAQRIFAKYAKDSKK